MSSRLIACALAFLAVAAVSAVDWEAFSAASGPELDPDLLDAMAHGDQETWISICTGITRRKDPSIGAFMETLAAGHTGTNDWRIEHCLRIILDGLLDGPLSTGERGARVDANAASLDVLFSSVMEWRDPQLLGLLVRAAALHPSPGGLQAVMNVGRRISEELESNGGFLMPQEASLALDFLASVRSLAHPDFLPQCADIARLSRDGILVDEARSVAGTLASR
jgi:hypothetical protein